ncbi:MAG: Maf family protein [Turicibacter sp.]|nr:Maf family protein [Turicibacter sp.]
MIVLASASPRRIALFKMAGFEFTVLPADIDEDINETDPVKMVAELSAKKAKAVQERVLPSMMIIGADTTVYIDGKILGKPASEQDAFGMLKLLQGRSHTVYTGVTVLKAAHEETFVESTAVTMSPLSDEEIWAYIATGEPMDKAGAYAIQDKGALLIEKIDGDFYNVVGLPLCRLNRKIKNFEA